MKTQRLGNAAEQAALDYLVSNGLQCVERNFACKMGEIDLIMIDQNALVFVEVRLRNNPRHGSGADSVTRSKMRKIIRTAELYLTLNTIPGNLDCRFDVISIDDKIDWIKGAFTLDSLT